MTWEEIVELLISFGQNVRVIRCDDADTVSLQLVPVAWFVSMKSSGALNVGIYEGDDNRLVGTRTIPFAELTPDFLREQVTSALAKQLALMLNPDGLHELFRGSHPRKRF